ncbi:MAG: hypothetical protein JEZ03_13135 [Bacteroidales bacterium]|nr:hypothetical protein [Bacteroidales bacterium]
MGLIRIALVLALIYYIVKIFSRFFLKYLIKKHQNQYDNQNADHQSNKEGDVSIKFDKNQKNLSDEIGEYIDYEDIKDD